MKITKIEAFHTAIPFTTGGPQIGARPGLAKWTKMEAVWVRVETDDGTVGWGEAFGNMAVTATLSMLAKVVAPWFIGRDPRPIVSLMREAHRIFAAYGRSGPTLFALSAMDIALWDIVAKIAQQPLYRILGGSSAAVDSYGSLMRYGGNVEHIQKNVGRVKDAGYKLVKLHENTIPAFRAARDVYGDGQNVLIDLNTIWTVAEARAIARKIRDDNYYWLEEPTWPPEDLAGLGQLRNDGVAIALGENLVTLQQFKDVCESGTVDFIQPSVVKVGGITAMQRIIALAQLYPVRISPHSFYYGPGYLATAHLITAMPAPAPLETAFITLEVQPHTLWNPDNPKLQLSDEPGLGFEPNPDVFTRCVVERHEIV